MMDHLNLKSAYVEYDLLYLKCQYQKFNSFQYANSIIYLFIVFPLDFIWNY